MISHSGLLFMNAPMPTDSSNGTGTVPPWMQAVDEETYYDATASEDTRPDRDASDSTASAPSTTPSSPNASSPNESPLSPSEEVAPSLEQKLSLSMDAPSDLPTPSPDLQPTSAGPIRTDLNRQIETAVAVLGSRYTSDLPKSLVLEVILRQALLALHKHGEESPLVQQLDSMLART
jgi:hypothetical protein